MATATRTATSRKVRRNTATKLTQRGIAAVAVAVAGLVLLAGFGHHGAALLGGAALYALVTGRVAALSAIVPDMRQALRGLCWVVVATTAVMSAQGVTGPGGATFGLALAAALATTLKLTATSRVARNA